MANFSSLFPRTSLKHAVTRAEGALTSSEAHLAAARKAVLGGEYHKTHENHDEPGLCSQSNGIRKKSAISNGGVLTGLFHHHLLLGARKSNKCAFLRVQTMSYQFVADAHVSTRTSIKTKEMPAVSDSSKRETDEAPRRHPIGENIPKKDRIKFLVNTLLDINDNKEAVYGALDAWVAWERNFPIASLKRVIAMLEKDQQWHRIIQVIKWMLSKGQGNTMGTYGQLIRALDMDHRPEEAHGLWKRKIGNDLHSVPWQVCRQMISLYYRNNMLDELIKLFKDLESYDRKPPDKAIVQKVADAYEVLGMIEEKERVMTKYADLFNVVASSRKSRKASRNNAKSGHGQPESRSDDAPDAENDGLQELQS